MRVSASFWNLFSRDFRGIQKISKNCSVEKTLFYNFLIIILISSKYFLEHKSGFVTKRKKVFTRALEMVLIWFVIMLNFYVNFFHKNQDWNCMISLSCLWSSTGVLNFHKLFFSFLIELQRVFRLIV